MFSEAAKNQMLDALTVDRIRLHSGDPGAAGANNQESGLEVAAFAAAAAGVRALNANVDVTGLTPSVAITWYSIWVASGTVFKGRGQITSGDLAANTAGEYSLTTATELSLVDPL